MRLVPILLAGMTTLVAPRLNAAVVHLHGGASVTGELLADKPDRVVVDLGFTVLAIAREHVLEILSANPDETGADPSPLAAIPSASSSDLFKTLDGTPTDQSVRDLVRQLGESVVQVRTPGGLGSGFFLNEEGYLITNFHVIEGETEISIEVYQQQNGELGREVYRDVRILAMNKFKDLALLKIEDAGATRFIPAPLGEVESLDVGERVFAIGSPLGLERTVTEGILSTKTRETMGELYLQTTAQINPGNSGGPLFNLRGEVVGVTNMKMQFGEGIGFAIPVDAVKYFLKYRDAFAYDKDNPSNAYRYLAPPGRAAVAEPETPAPVPSEETKPRPTK